MTWNRYCCYLTWLSIPSSGSCNALFLARSSSSSLASRSLRIFSRSSCNLFISSALYLSIAIFLDFSISSSTFYTSLSSTTDYSCYHWCFFISNLRRSVMPFYCTFNLFILSFLAERACRSESMARSLALNLSELISLSL